MGDNSSDSNSDEELYLMTIGIVTAIKSKKSENTDIGLEKSIEIEMLMVSIFFRNLKHFSSSSANNIFNSPRVLKYLSLFIYYFIYLFLLNDLIIACCRHTK